MADASSDFEIAPGRITKPANKYANQIPPRATSPPPSSIIARDGRTNNPLPNIADNESITTENNPNFLSKVSVTDSNGCALTLNFDIAEPDELEVSASVTDALCNFNNQGGFGSALVEITGGVEPYDITYFENKSFREQISFFNNLFALDSLSTFFNCIL